MHSQKAESKTKQYNIKIISAETNAHKMSNVNYIQKTEI